MTWVNSVIQGLLLGGQYALIACGLSLTFGVMRIVNLAHGDLAVCGAYLGLVLSSALGVPVWATLPLLLPAAFGAGVGLQVLLFGRALRHGVLAPVLVTFGLSVMIENLLLVAATSDPRGLPGGSLALDSFHIGRHITVSWLFMTAFLTACAVLSGLQLLLSRTSWGRKVRATADDLDTARLVGIRVRPLFAGVAGIAVATAALAGVFIGTIGTFDPLSGTNTLIFAFEAVVIGGIGSLWGTLVGGMALGVTQVVVGQINQAYAVLAVHLLFLAVLAVRPNGLFASHAGVYLLVRRTFGLDARAVGSDPVAAASAGVRVGRIRRVAYLVAGGGAGAVGAVIALQTLYIEPNSVFSIQYSVYMLFMVLIGGMGTIEGPVLGALVLFGLQEALSSYGAWYLVIVGGLAVIATLAASRGLWGLASDRFGWSLLPVGYRVRTPRG